MKFRDARRERLDVYEDNTAERRRIAGYFDDGEEQGVDSNAVRAYAVAWVWAQAPGMFDPCALGALIDAYYPEGRAG